MSLFYLGKIEWVHIKRLKSDTTDFGRIFFFSAGVEPFKEQYISRSVLKQLIRQNIVQTMNPETADSEKKNYIYECGKECDYFVLILEGKFLQSCSILKIITVNKVLKCIHIHQDHLIYAFIMSQCLPACHCWSCFLQLIISNMDKQGMSFEVLSTIIHGNKMPLFGRWSCEGYQRDELLVTDP